jgi:hypothetical protein
MATMTHYVGEVVTAEDLGEAFGDQIEFVKPDKIFVRGFVEFQYSCSVNNLNPENKVHLSVINILKKYGAYKPLASPIQGAKDKDKDKDKEKKGECEGKTQIEALYLGYPRKQGKSSGLRRLKADLKSGESIQAMVQARDNYVAHLKRARTEPQFVLHFSTWANQWRDWLDPEHGTIAVSIAPKGPPRIQDILAQEENGGAA